MDTLLAFFIGLVFGVVYYFFDFKQFKPWYRKWYGITHKDPLPEDSDLGFVYGQPFSGKLYTAVFLAFAITVIIILTGSDNIIIQLLYGLFIVIGLLAAFYLAPLLFRHGSNRFKKVTEAINKIDDFEARINKEAAEEQTKTESNKEDETPEKKDDDNKDDKDWRSGVKDFLND